MTKRLLGAAIGVGALVMVAGCSSDPNAKYCDLYENQSVISRFEGETEFNWNGLGPFGPYIKDLDGMIEVAPSDIKGDLETMAQAFRTLEDAGQDNWLKVHDQQAPDAGVDLDALAQAKDGFAQKSEELCR